MNVSDSINNIGYFVILIFIFLYFYRLYIWLTNDSTFGEEMLLHESNPKPSLRPKTNLEPVNDIFLTIICKLSPKYKEAKNQLTNLKLLINDLLPNELKFEVICPITNPSGKILRNLSELQKLIPGMKIFNLEFNDTQNFVICSFFSRGIWIVDASSIKYSINEIIKKNKSKRFNYAIFSSPEICQGKNSMAKIVAISKISSIQLFRNLHHFGIGSGMEMLILCNMLNIKIALKTYPFSTKLYDIIILYANALYGSFITLLYKFKVYSIKGNNSKKNR
ncbi:hypothetical protein TRFO_31826 [Tritrichomonas foetus]|uniref:Uncharacterized protein n=1 Tax=Tritrichomonas foetus TaxID=1144522 RepID=A0A1J4JSJ5_9EUKA|nr:hypothetical protein TRFO_31826 [Tritrichomonas foetus]|eukprot:OHT01392.1 hypothetical protein TRFO_31826 [Tritrichomonas foetus]